MDASREELNDDLNHQIPRKPYPQYIDETVFLSIKSRLKQHPDKILSTWAHTNPRLYVLLRMLGCDDEAVYQRFESESINDFWLPLGTQTLERLATFTEISPRDWRLAQYHVLSPSEQLGERILATSGHFHRHVQDGSAHFEQLEVVGTGATAEVTRVRHVLSGTFYACKRIVRGLDVKAQRNQLLEFTTEVDVLKRVQHHHLVSLVTSFTDLTSFSIILNPVAQDVLKSLLNRQSRTEPLSDFDVSTLRRAFGCLATALTYLHQEKLRHKDIKPGNILISGGRVILCDFGISRDWSKADNSTTEGEVLKFTRRYCAPEVIGRDPRNTSSDVWSLGCVYLEIISVVKGYPMEEVNEFLREASGGGSGQGLWCAQEAMNAWMVNIRSPNNDSADDIPLSWITAMIRSEQKTRITASKLVEMIFAASINLPRPDLYNGSCCMRANSSQTLATEESPTLNIPSFSPGGLGTSPPQHPDRKMFRSSSYWLPIGIRSATVEDPTISFSDGSSGDERIKSTHYQHPPRRDDSVSPRTQSPDLWPSAESRNVSKIPTTQEKLPSNAIMEGPKPTADRTDSVQPPQPANSLHADSDSAFSPTIQNRAPVQPPAGMELKCGCGAKSQEKHILNLTYSSHPESFRFDPSVPTIDTCPKCEVGKNRIQVYEDQSQVSEASERSTFPRLWRTTRRLVVSHLSGAPPMRLCSSFWLPLADIQTKLVNNEVSLQWSDCNRTCERASGNYSTHYDCVYDPKHPNNFISIQFDTLDDAQQLIDTVSLPYIDNKIVSNVRTIKASSDIEVRIFDVGRPGVRNYRAVTHRTVEDALATSKLFIQWPEIDLDISIVDTYDDRSAETLGYKMVVQIHNVNTPTYLSDTRGEPASDHGRVGRFSKAHQKITSLEVPFQIGAKHGFPKPPSGVVDLLRGLTSWTLCYFAIVTKFRSKNKHMGSKKYKAADLMIWEKEVYDGEGRRRGAQIAFRLHQGTDPLWISGKITDSTSIFTTIGFDATIAVSNKSSGQLLDVRNMTSVFSPGIEKKPEAGHSGVHEGFSDLVLTFENEKYRLDFVNVVTRLKSAAATAHPLSETATSSDLMRRISSIASADMSSRPPMRK